MTIWHLTLAIWQMPWQVWGLPATMQLQRWWLHSNGTFIQARFFLVWYLHNEYFYANICCWGFTKSKPPSPCWPQLDITACQFLSMLVAVLVVGLTVAGIVSLTKLMSTMHPLETSWLMWHLSLDCSETDTWPMPMQAELKVQTWRWILSRYRFQPKS